MPASRVKPVECEERGANKAETAVCFDKLVSTQNAKRVQERSFSLRRSSRSMMRRLKEDVTGGESNGAGASPTVVPLFSSF